MICRDECFEDALVPSIQTVIGKEVNSVLPQIYCCWDHKMFHLFLVTRFLYKCLFFYNTVTFILQILNFVLVGKVSPWTWKNTNNRQFSEDELSKTFNSKPFSTITWLTNIRDKCVHRQNKGISKRGEVIFTLSKVYLKWTNGRKHTAQTSPKKRKLNKPVCGIPVFFSYWHLFEIIRLPGSNISNSTSSYPKPVPLQ